MNNPLFSRINVNDVESLDFDASTASYKGISIKTALLLGLSIISAILCASGLIPSGILYILLGISLFGSIFVVLIGSLVPSATMVCSIIYAICEGALLGLISAILETVFPGIVSGAIICTITIFAVMLGLYAFGIVRVTSKFRSFMMIAGISLILFYGVFTIGYMLNWSIAVEFFGYGAIGVIVSLVIIIYASFNYMLDFDNATHIVEAGADKKYEWRIAMGLMLTTLWIYIEILRLLVIIASMNRKD